MAKPDTVRWGIVGTANIARAQFLPGLREAGGGRPVLVASRDGARAAAYAADQGIDAGVADYAAVVESPDVDAVYVALPNALHAEWTAAALRAGKAVLCEKPLCVGAAQTEDGARGRGGGRRAAVGGVRLSLPGPAPAPEGAAGRRGDRRARRAVQRVPLPAVRTRPTSGWTPRWAAARWPTWAATRSASRSSCSATSRSRGRRPARRSSRDRRAGAGVETDAAGIVTFGSRRLLLTCGFRRSSDTGSRVLGAAGQVQLTNPFHPGPADTLTVLRSKADPVVERPTRDQRSFTAALRHVHAVLRGDCAPRHTAAGFALPAARVLERLQRLARAAGER